MKLNKTVSIIIPAYNEEKYIEKCLVSLRDQSYKDIEIIVIDDGSIDSTKEIATKYANLVLEQDHMGPGTARNFGVSKAKGDIVSFIDADMYLDKFYIEEITRPIFDGKAKGSSHTIEYVGNIDNVWAKCYNIAHRLPLGLRAHPSLNNGYLFRVILKKEFIKVNGFNTDGDINDDNIREKIAFEPALVNSAICFHNNPGSIKEVFKHSVWTGKSKDNQKYILWQVIVHLLPFSIIRSILPMIKFRVKEYVIYKIISDFGLITGCIEGMYSKKYYE